MLTLLLASIVCGGGIGYIRHQRKRKPLIRIQTDHGEKAAQLVTQEGTLKTGWAQWHSPHITPIPPHCLLPQEICYFALWAEHVKQSKKNEAQRALKKGGWFTLPIALHQGKFTEARLLPGEVEGWVLGHPGMPMKNMRVLSLIAQHSWVLDSEFNYCILPGEDIGCVVHFGHEQMLWLSEEPFMDEHDIEPHAATEQYQEDTTTAGSALAAVAAS